MSYSPGVGNLSVSAQYQFIHVSNYIPSNTVPDISNNRNARMTCDRGIILLPR